MIQTQANTEAMIESANNSNTEINQDIVLNENGQLGNVTPQNGDQSVKMQSSQQKNGCGVKSKQQSKIQWTEVVWNPTTGCTHISKECLNCYAEKETNRLKYNPSIEKYRKGFDVIVEHKDTLLEPFSWKEPTTVFVNSMSDLFHKDVSLEFIKQVFKVMNDTPQHTYQILTKRHHLLEEYSDQLNWTDNIWMGVSVGEQVATRRIDSLRKCGAKNKFISIEPLIEEITEMNLDGIDWVIAGGESGDNSVRQMEMGWVIKIKDFCEQYNVPFFFKQWGKTRNNPDQNDPTINKGHRYHAKGGCMLDGELHLNNPSVHDDSVPSIKLFDDRFYVMDEVSNLKTIWELKSHLPLMEDELYKQLKADIKTNGINDPILYWVTTEGIKLVIEGHTRLSAAIQLNLQEIPTKEIKETFKNLDEIKLWMIRHQFKKRNLSDEQKIELAYRSKDTIERLAKENLSKAGKKIGVDTPIDTTAEIAKIAGVGRSTVVRYAYVMKNAHETVKENVRKSKLSIGGAYSSLKDVAGKAKSDRKILSSIEEGTELIKSGEIDAVIVLSDMNQIQLLNKKQSLRIGIYILNEQKTHLKPKELSPELAEAA